MGAKPRSTVDVQTVIARVINFKDLQMETSLKYRILHQSFTEVNFSLTVEVDEL